VVENGFVMLLSSRVGLAIYKLLPNRLAWACLSEKERACVARGNVFGNTRRADYADPAQYQAGVGFDTLDGHRLRNRHQLQAFLDRVRPASVLEVGPGSGYLTRMIVTYPTVQRYVGTDINGAFLDYIHPRVTALRPDLSTDFVEGTVADVPAELFDAAVLCSVVHHIPDRDALFREVGARLRSGGRVLAVDPTHYVLQILKIIRKISKPGNLARQLDEIRRCEYGTHTMCQLAEYRAIAAQTGFKVTRVEFSEQPRRLEQWRKRGRPVGPLWRWMAQEILVECERMPDRHDTRGASRA
jgi:SAM-dependent methyltransferase